MSHTESHYDRNIFNNKTQIEGSVTFVEVFSESWALGEGGAVLIGKNCKVRENYYSEYQRVWKGWIREEGAQGT